MRPHSETQSLKNIYEKKISKISVYQFFVHELGVKMKRQLRKGTKRTMKSDDKGNSQKGW